MLESISQGLLTENWWYTCGHIWWSHQSIWFLGSEIFHFLAILRIAEVTPNPLLVEEGMLNGLPSWACSSNHDRGKFVWSDWPSYFKTSRMIVSGLCAKIVVSKLLKKISSNSIGSMEITYRISRIVSALNSFQCI